MSILAEVRKIIAGAEKLGRDRPASITVPDDWWHALFDEGDALRWTSDPIPREQRESIHICGVRILKETTDD